MKSSASTVETYLAGLPEVRRAAVSAVRSVILANLPRGFEEGMQHRMIGYYVPLEVVGEAIARTPVDDFIAAYERSRARVTR